jgi:hypothetical protein
LLVAVEVVLMQITVAPQDKTVAVSDVFRVDMFRNLQVFTVVVVAVRERTVIILLRAPPELKVSWFSGIRHELQLRSCC